MKRKSEEIEKVLGEHGLESTTFVFCLQQQQQQHQSFRER